jgi:hypothetical protein
VGLLFLVLPALAKGTTIYLQRYLQQKMSDKQLVFQDLSKLPCVGVAWVCSAFNKRCRQKRCPTNKKYQNICPKLPGIGFLQGWLPCTDCSCEKYINISENWLPLCYLHLTKKEKTLQKRCLQQRMSAQHCLPLPGYLR